MLMRVHMHPHAHIHVHTVDARSVRIPLEIAMSTPH